MTSMRKKPIKRKKITFTLPEREGEVLSLYAKEKGISRPDAVRRMVRATLREYSSSLAKAEPRNQLGLFDVVQMEMFEN